MLEEVDFSKGKMPKAQYKERYEDLTRRLVVLQQRARSAGVGLVVLFEGWEGAGKGSRISDLMYRLDARATHVFEAPRLDASDVEDFPGRGRGVTGYYPFLQEFWKALGERGTMTFYDRGWYTAAMQQALPFAKDMDRLRRIALRCEESIRSFERQLTDDGYLVVKFFVHVTKKAQRKRLERLHDDPATRWRVPDKKLSMARGYEERYLVFDRLLEASNFDFAPWVLVNGEDKRRANLTIAQTLVGAIEGELARRAEAGGTSLGAAAGGVSGAGAAADVVSATGTAAADVATETAARGFGGVSAGADDEAASRAGIGASTVSRYPLVENPPRLADLRHDLVLDPEEYRRELKRLQRELFRLENLMYQARVPLMIMYEGWDAAGKGGNIKRVAQALDARSYTIFPSPAPTQVELAHPHLWRYWTRLPKAGHVGLYDRSWYGRVLVERVEGFATPDQWHRAYDEINAFECDIVDWGAILLKFWVEVSDAGQLRRFEERAKDPSKQWKITDEDWRNREKRPLYAAAIDDMFRLTSTTFAPWIVLESDDKRHARIKALRAIVAALRDRLGA